jgi:hypothetical protein
LFSHDFLILYSTEGFRATSPDPEDLPDPEE